MSDLLRSGQVGNIQLRTLTEQRKLVVDRWEKTGLLEGLKGHARSNVAQLLENQAGYLQESTQTSDVMGFDIVAFPMVRRVFSRLLANEIVSVQPMTLPTGLIFYIDHKVETSPGSGTYTSVYDLHYNNKGFENSFGSATSVSESVTGAVSNNVATMPYSGGVEGLASLSVVGYSGVTAAGSASGTGIQFVINPQTWQQDLFASNQVSITVPDSMTQDDGQSGAINYVRAVWSSYTSLEANSGMGQVKMTVSSVTVQVASRKLKAVWTPELAQDLAAYHSVDAEAELTALLSEELAAEIDREIIRDIINVAPFELTWNYSRTAVSQDSSGRTVAGDPASGYITQKEWNQTLITAINKISAEIHRRTLRGGANWIVCSTEVGAVLNDIEKFHAANEAEQMDFNMGIEKMGTLGVSYKVFKDPYLPDWVCLLGHKGANFMDTGFVYAPYIPFQLTPAVLDPDDFTPRKGILTRYAKKCVNNKYFGLVRVVFPDTYDVINRS